MPIVNRDVERKIVEGGMQRGWNEDQIKTAVLKYRENPSAIGGQTSPTSSVATQPQAEKQPGFLGKAVQAIAKPFVKTAATGLAAVEGVGRTIGALPGGVNQEELNKINQATTRERDFGFLGSSRPVNVQDTGEVGNAGQFARDVIGTGLEIGSYATPGAFLKGGATAAAQGAKILAKPALSNLIKGSIKAGATAGATGSAGSALAQDDTNVGNVVGQTALGAITGGVLGGAGARLGQGLRRGADVAMDTGRNVAKQTGEFVQSQALRLEPSTVRTIQENADIFRKGIPQTDIEDIAGKVKGAFDNRLDNLEMIGKEYEPVRLATPAKPLEVLPTGTHKIIADTLNRFGLQIDEAGNILPPTKSTIGGIRQSDLPQIQEFVDQFGKGQLETGGEVLNLRQKLDLIANWDKDATSGAQKLAKALRKDYDKWAKESIEGLESADVKFAPEKKFLNEVKKSLFDKDGELKETALGKLSNLLNVNNKIRLKKIEKLAPGITKDLQILKAIYDIERAAGAKTGTYIGSMLGSIGTIGAAASGNIPLAILLGAGSMIAQTPQNAVRIILAFSETAGKSQQFAQKVIEKMGAGKALTFIEKKFVRDVFNIASQALKQAPARAATQGIVNEITQ